MLIGPHDLGDTSSNFTNTSSNNQNNTVSLRCTHDHIFDKISVSWSISDDHIFTGLKFPQGDTHGDTIFTLSFKFFQDPGISKGDFPILADSFSKMLMVILLIPTTFVEQMASSNRLA